MVLISSYTDLTLGASDWLVAEVSVYRPAGGHFVAVGNLSHLGQVLTVGVPVAVHSAHTGRATSHPGGIVLLKLEHEPLVETGPEPHNNWLDLALGGGQHVGCLQ
jgi:hypothetical protein